MKMTTPNASNSFGNNLVNSELKGLSAELLYLRDHPPITYKGNGIYEGDILGFVKGLRFSARLIYYLRTLLSLTGYEINWGHILDDAGNSCSRECDIIIHKPGHVKNWNGDAHPVMNFVFVKASQVIAIVSCKSKITDIDKKYILALKKYGVKKIYLFAECCMEKSYSNLLKKAQKAGYQGLWCLHLIDSTGRRVEDENLHQGFSKSIKKGCDSTRSKSGKSRKKKVR